MDSREIPEMNGKKCEHSKSGRSLLLMDCNLVFPILAVELLQVAFSGHYHILKMLLADLGSENCRGKILMMADRNSINFKGCFLRGVSRPSFLCE